VEKFNRFALANQCALLRIKNNSDIDSTGDPYGSFAHSVGNVLICGDFNICCYVFWNIAK
jgi:hypothetical protein